MMKAIYTTLVAAVLALATMGQSLALDGDDVKALQEIADTQAIGSQTAIENYITEQGENVHVYTGVDAQKFDTGMQLFAGIAAPQGTVAFVFGDPDPADASVLIMIFDADGKALGGGWIGQQIVEAAMDYVEAGI